MTEPIQSNMYKKKQHIGSIWPEWNNLIQYHWEHLRLLWFLVVMSAVENVYPSLMTACLIRKIKFTFMAAERGKRSAT